MTQPNAATIRDLSRPPLPGTCRMHSRFPPATAPRPRPAVPARCADRGLAGPRGHDAQARGRAALRLGLAAVAVGALSACATGPKETATALPFQVTPVLRLDHGPFGANLAYGAGKAALSDGRPSLALSYFEQAASMRPGWGDALNGRVVALARLGRTEEAVRAAQDAVAAGHQTDELLANLAQLRGRLAQAGMPQPPVPTVPAVVASTPAPVVAIAVPVQTALAAPTKPDPVPPATADDTPAAPTVVAAAAAPRLHWAQTGSQVLELRMDASAAPAAVPTIVMAAMVPVPVSGPVLRMTLEVSNGAGRTGLAKGTASALRTAGVATQRITNHANFKVRQTEIQYRTDADAAAARKLARSFAFAVAVVANPDLGHGVNVRVVLGRDAAERAAQARPLTRVADSGEATRAG